MFSKLAYIILFMSLLACGRLDPQEKKDEEVGFNTGLKTYVTDDEAGGLFEKVQWYSYYFAQHSLISVLDVYALRSNNRFYKMQIIEFYRGDDNTQLGYYTLRLDNGDGVVTLDVDAHACGSPQSNPDYGRCQASDRNVFTYVRLSDYSVFNMSDDEAKKSLDWDIAFKAENIKLNSGLSGPGNVAGALLSREDRFTNTSIDDGERFNALFEAKRNGSDLGRFNQNYDFLNQRFFGPDGVERVVYEDFWYQENAGVRSAIPSNWWIVKNNGNAGFSKFNVGSIQETTDASGVITSQVTFFVHTQEENDEFFPLRPESYSLELKSKKRKIYCLDLNNTVSVVRCKKDDPSWDIRFINNRRKWSIETRSGALGPVSQGVVSTINTGF